MAFWDPDFWVASYWAQDFWEGDVPAIPSAVLTGTAIGVDWTVIRDTGGTIIVRLLNDTFIAAGTGPIGTTAESDAFVQSFVAAESSINGWNNEISLDNTDLTRDSDTQLTITIPATATYAPLKKENIAGTVQAALLVVHGSDIGTSRFVITKKGRKYQFFGGIGRLR